MSANALPVIARARPRQHPLALSLEPTIYERAPGALAGALNPYAAHILECWWTVTAAGGSARFERPVRATAAGAERIIDFLAGVLSCRFPQG